MSSRSETTMNHVSHPHPLQLSNHQTIATCSGCKSQATGMIYSCKTCNFFLHPNCAKMPKTITHPFDTKGHVLILRPKENLYNYCDACGKVAHGFCYHCKICQIDLHILCASAPLTFTHQSHPHPLKLLFSPSCPEKGFLCDVCCIPGSNNWVYRCDGCDFDVHLQCKDVPMQPVKQANMHQQYYQTNFQGFPNQTPVPPAAQTEHQHPGFTHSKSAPQVPPPPPHPHPHAHPPQGPHYQSFIPPGPPPYPTTGVPVNHAMDPNVLAFIQRLQAITDAQNRMSQQQLHALFAGGRAGGFGGVFGGFGGGRMGGGGFGGIQNLIQALSGGGNIPGLDQLISSGGGGGMSDILQGLMGGGGIGGLDLGSLLGGFGLG